MRVPTSWNLSGVALAAGLATAAGSPAAASQVIDFTPAACDGGCTSSASISQAYGDTQFVNVSYRAVDGRTNATIEPYLRYWQEIGDLQGAVYGGDDSDFSFAEVSIAANAGYELSLESFDFGTYQGRHSSATFFVTDLAGRVILPPTTTSTNWPTHGSLTLAGRYADGVVIRWRNSYDNAIDNIRYDVRPVVAGAAPEPGTWALMIVGCGAAGTALRRSRRRAADTIAA